MTADIRPFGTTADGQEVSAIRLQAGELQVVLLTWGAVVQDLRLAGTPWPLVLGSDQLAAYERVMDYFGAVVGPVANRIGGARVRIAGEDHGLEANDGPDCLHGGTWGTQRRIWALADAGKAHALLRLVLPDGEGGLPGKRVIEALYRIEPPSTLRLSLRAITDRPTLMNPASHCYWNLDASPTIQGHRLRVVADRFLPTRKNLPTGEVAAVHGAFDLREGRVFDLSEGFDHNWCLSNAPRPLTEVAVLEGSRGVRLTLATTAPGLQVFDGATLETRPFLGHLGQPYGPHAGVALEPQHWPNAPNNPGFPSVLLPPDGRFEQETCFTLSR